MLIALNVTLLESHYPKLVRWFPFFPTYETGVFCSYQIRLSSSFDITHQKTKDERVTVCWYSGANGTTVTQ